MMDSYFSLILNRPLFQIWSIFLLALARIVPTIALAPFLGAKMVGDPTKIGFGISLTFLVLPALVTQVTEPLAIDLTFMFLMIKEIIIGAIFGLIIATPFYFSQGAGALIDHQRGSQSLQVMDPSTQMQTSPTGTLYNNMMLVSFFWVGGPILFFQALFGSYAVLPIDKFLPAAFFATQTPVWLVIMRLIHDVVQIALQLSAPSLIAMLLSDLFLGIANRMAPQVQISFLMWSFKAFVGIGFVWLAWWLTLKQLDHQAISWVKMFQKLVNTITPVT